MFKKTTSDVYSQKEQFRTFQ